MIVFRTFLTILTSYGTNISQTSETIFNSLSCPATVTEQHELCTSEKCSEPDMTDITRYDIDPALAFPRQEEICTTLECLRISDRILQNMLKKVNPCNDFYAYACGSFIRDTKMPQYLHAYNPHTSRSDQYYGELIELMEQPENPFEPRPFKLVKTLFRSCLDESKLSTQPLLELLRKLGGFPLVDGKNWHDPSFTWEESVSRCRKFGCSIDFFLGLTVKPRIAYGAASEPVIELSQPSFENIMSTEILDAGPNDPRVIDYTYLMEQVTMALLSKGSIINITEIHQCVKFQVEMATIVHKYYYKTRSAPIYLTIAQLQAKYPISIPWVQFFNNLLKPLYTIKDDHMISLRDEPMIRDLLKLYAGASNRTLANYAWWRVIAESLVYVPEKLRTYHLGLLDFIEPTSLEKFDHFRCGRTISRKMSLAVAAMHANQFFNSQMKDSITEIFDNIKQKYMQMLQEAQWIDVFTKERMLGRAQTMLAHIAFPYDLLKTGKVDRHYSDLNITEDKFFESMLNVSILENNYLYIKLWQLFNSTICTNHEHFPGGAVSYSDCDNSIDISIDYIRQPFFSMKAPTSMNYGGMGSLIGNLMIEYFNLSDTTIAKTTKDSFLNMSKCVEDKYSLYSVEDYKSNSFVPLKTSPNSQHNLKDIFSIKIANLAYESWKEINKDVPVTKLYGLNKFTDKQLFWLNYANTLCSKEGDVYVERILINSETTPLKYRVNGPLSNSEYFAADFNCTVGSPMNPVNKCQVY